MRIEAKSVWCSIGKDTKIKKELGPVLIPAKFKDFEIGQSIKAWYLGYVPIDDSVTIGKLDKILILE